MNAKHNSCSYTKSNWKASGGIKDFSRHNNICRFQILRSTRHFIIVIVHFSIVSLISNVLINYEFSSKFILKWFFGLGSLGRHNVRQYSPLCLCCVVVAIAVTLRWPGATKPSGIRGLSFVASSKCC